MSIPGSKIVQVEVVRILMIMMGYNYPLVGYLVLSSKVVY